MQKQYSFLCLSFLFLVPFCLGAQPRFDQMDTQETFSGSIAYQLAQDSFGNVWVTTEEGLVRFNSHQAYSYTAGNQIPMELGQGLRAVHVDQKGEIWIAGDGGVGQYDAKTDDFKTLPTGKTPPNLIKGIARGKDGKLWVAAFNGLWQYKSVDEPPVRVAQVRNLSCLSVGENDILFGAKDGLYQLSTLTGEWIKAVADKDVSTVARSTEGYLYGTDDGQLYRLSYDLLSNDKVAEFGAVTLRVITRNNDGGWYVGTDGGGVYVLDEDFREIANYSNDVNDIHSISSDGVYDLLTDREGILWIATYGGGVNKLNPYGNAFRHLNHVANTDRGLAHPFTRAILQDSLGQVWFGTKDGISIWSRKDGNWHHLLRDLPDGVKRIVTGLSTYGNEVWAATYQGDLFRINIQDLRLRRVTFARPEDERRGRIFSIKHDSSGNLWIGGINMNVYCREPDGVITAFPISQVRVLMPVENGGVWVGGRTGIQHIQGGAFIEGVNAERSRGTGAKIMSLEAVDRYRQSQGFLTVSSILPSPQGDLYIGTNGAGLLHYDNQMDSVKSLDADGGLPSQVVQSILQDDDANLWVATSRGLAYLENGKTNALPEVYTQADGLIGTEFNEGSAARLASGELLFGGVDGVNLFDPESVGSTVDAPSVILEDFYLFNERQRPGTETLPAHLNKLDVLHLNYDQNAFTLHFAGVSHAADSKVRYRWQLSGLNDRWSEATTLDQLNFTNLSTGKYTFRVAASTSPGNWGEARALSIVISPPWWKTWWAYLIYAALAIGAIYLAFRVSRSLIRRRNVEKQIDFFNNITHELKTPLAILLASLEDITEGTDNGGGETVGKIRSTIKRLTSLFEQLLNFHKASSSGKSRHVSAFTPGPHLQELVDRFIPLTRERELSLVVDDSLAPDVFHYDKGIFDKIVFNLVSNAVKYSRPGGKVRVELSVAAASELELRVIDNGIGIPADQQRHILREYYRARNAVNSQLPGTGLGLMMVKNMVEKEGGSIRFESKENQGTTFYVRMSDRQSDLALAPPPLPSLPDTDREVADSNSHILLVEDNDELRARLGSRLSRYYKVSTAANGQEGLAMASEHFPDLIITDLIMPEMDGMELSRAVQADIQLNHIPIFLLTVLHNSDQKVASIAAGVSEYLEKPVNFDLLLAKINNTLNWRQRMRERYAATDEVELAAQHRTERENEFIGELESFTVENISNASLSVQDLCRHLGMSRTSLYMKMKNLIDLSPQDFIIHTRLKESRRMLTESGETIKTIAYDCGFSNPKYFSTSFKKKYGESPGAFRKGLVKD